MPRNAYHRWDDQETPHRFGCRKLEYVRLSFSGVGGRWTPEADPEIWQHWLSSFKTVLNNRFLLKLLAPLRIDTFQWFQMEIKQSCQFAGSANDAPVERGGGRTSVGPLRIRQIESQGPRTAHKSRPRNWLRKFRISISGGSRARADRGRERQAPRCGTGRGRLGWLALLAPHSGRIHRERLHLNFVTEPVKFNRHFLKL